MSKLLIMAGGTGGHIFPALAVAQKLKSMGHEIIWLGSENSMEIRIIPGYDIPIQTIPMKGFRGKGFLAKIKIPFTLFKSISMAMSIIKQQQIQGVIGFGGFVTFPGGLAAKILNKPLIIHEQNAIAGLSNKLLAIIANQTFYAFPKTFKDNDGYIGNPVRDKIVNLPIPSTRFKHRPAQLSLLIIGGSLGAEVFNEKLPLLLSKIPLENRPVIKHQCGRSNFEKVFKRYQSLNIKVQVFEFIEDIADEYAKADYIICRAGALTIAELTVVGLGGYLIPFPFAVDDHQTANAEFLVSADAAECIQQNDFDIDVFADKLAHLSREHCLKWANNARNLAILDADKKIADKILSLI